MVLVNVPKDVGVDSRLSFEVGRTVVWCPHLHRVRYVAQGTDYNRTWNKCTLDDGHCDYGGRRFKFRTCWTDLKVVWVCPKLAKGECGSLG